jgi:hypothetical protein
MQAAPDRSVNGAPLRSVAAPRPVRGRIPELSGIEFTGRKSVEEYAKALRDLFRDLTAEIEFGSGELYEVLKRQDGHMLLMGLDVKIRAYRVRKRLDRLARITGGGAIESVAFYAEFRRQFIEALHEERKPKKIVRFDFEN